VVFGHAGSAGPRRECPILETAPSVEGLIPHTVDPRRATRPNPGSHGSSVAPQRRLIASTNLRWVRNNSRARSPILVNAASNIANRVNLSSTRRLALHRILTNASDALLVIVMGRSSVFPLVVQRDVFNAFANGTKTIEYRRHKPPFTARNFWPGRRWMSADCNRTGFLAIRGGTRPAKPDRDEISCLSDQSHRTQSPANVPQKRGFDYAPGFNALRVAVASA
jgi:hypothetical protein